MLMVTAAGTPSAPGRADDDTHRRDIWGLAGLVAPLADRGSDS